MGALIPFAVWLSRDAGGIGMLISSLLLVVIVKLVNSAIEAVIDGVGDEPQQLSGGGKNLCAGAVFVALILARALWLSVIIDYLG